MSTRISLEQPEKDCGAAFRKSADSDVVDVAVCGELKLKDDSGTDCDRYWLVEEPCGTYFIVHNIQLEDCYKYV